MNTLLKRTQLYCKFERLFVPFDLNCNIFAIFKFFTDFAVFGETNRFLVHGVVLNQGNPAKEQGFFLK